MEILNTIVLILILLVLGVIGYFLKDSPNLFRELKVENRKSENRSNLQREAYFREISGRDLEETFSKWMSLITDFDSTMKTFNSTKGQRIYSEMVHKCLMYGSENTVDILSCLSQFQYRLYGKNNSVNSLDSYKSLMYISSLIVSLKYDFTGININPMQLIETKMKDLDEGENKITIQKANKQVQKEIEQYRKQKE